MNAAHYLKLSSSWPSDKFLVIGMTLIVTFVLRALEHDRIERYKDRQKLLRHEDRLTALEDAMRYQLLPGEIMDDRPATACFLSCNSKPVDEDYLACELD